MKVVYFHRKRGNETYSLEGYFDTLRKFIPQEIESAIAESTFISRGIFKRLYNIVEAPFRQGDVNHITGDVHYLSYFLKKDKTLLTILDCVFTQYSTGYRNKILRYLWYVIPEKRASLISVISQSTKNELLKVISCNPDKIKVVPICISSNFIYKDKEFNEKKPLILQVGTKENKNLLRLFKALRGIPCRLDLVGKLSEAQTNALKEHNIEYSNSWGLPESEIIRKYEDCDMVTLISTYEGFGMPILEANAVGRVVVTSNIMSMPEVAGNAACLVDPYSIDSIRDGILRVIKEKEYRDSLILNGLKNMLRFKPEIIINKYMTLYNEIICKGS